MASLKQKKALENIIENHGNVSRAMLDAGYTSATATNPKNLTESKGYRQLLIEAGLDENKLKEKMKEWIDAVKVHSSVTEPDRVVPDYQTQLKAGEMLRDDLKIKENTGEFTKMTVTFE